MGFIFICKPYKNLRFNFWFWIMHSTDRNALCHKKIYAPRRNRATIAKLGTIVASQRIFKWLTFWPRRIKVKRVMLKRNVQLTEFKRLNVHTEVLFKRIERLGWKILWLKMPLKPNLRSYRQFLDSKRDYSRSQRSKLVKEAYR